MSAADTIATGHGTRPGPGHRLRRIDKAIGLVLFLSLVCLLLFPFIVFVVHPGEVAVLFRLLTTGTETEFVYPEGLGVKWPWNRIYRYEVRTQANDETVYGLATDGLALTVSVTVLFHPRDRQAGLLHKNVGPDYIARLVRPSTIEAVRDIIGKFGPHDIYKIDTNALEQRILDKLRDEVASNYIDFQGVIVRHIQLPEALNHAITRKLTEEQNALAYEYLISQTAQEAERKRIEAIGIQTFYSIVANALTPQLLTWRGIEATVEVAKTNNTKIVIVGSGKDQLPLILGSDITNQPNLPAPSPADPRAFPLPRFEELPRMFPPLPPSRPQQTSGGTAAPPEGDRTTQGGAPEAASGTRSPQPAAPQ